MSEKKREFDAMAVFTEWDSETPLDVRNENGVSQGPYLAKRAIVAIANNCQFVKLEAVEQAAIVRVGWIVGKAKGLVLIDAADWDVLTKVINANKCKLPQQEEMPLLTPIVHSQIKRLVDEATLVE